MYRFLLALSTLLVLIVSACAPAAAPAAAPTSASAPAPTKAAAAPAAQPTAAPAAKTAVNYPTKPITFIVPYGPGGTTDLSGRIMAQALENILGQPVVVENKEGGGGAVGLSLLYKAAPDGYTIAVGTGTNTTVAPHTAQVAYDPLKMSYIAGYGEWRYALLASSKMGWKTVEEMAAWGKANSGKVILSTTGGFGLLDVGMGLVAKNNGGFEYRTLPSNSAAESIARQLAGDANIRVGSPGTNMDYVRDGTFTPLLIMSNSWPELEKMGVPKAKDKYGFSLANNFTIIGPPGLPEPIRQKLEDTVATAMKDQATLDRLKKLSDDDYAFKTSSDVKAETEKLYKDFGVIVEQLGAKKK